MIKTICQGEEELFATKDEAIKTFVERTRATTNKGKRVRFLNVLLDLCEGKEVCWDVDGYVEEN